MSAFSIGSTVKYKPSEGNDIIGLLEDVQHALLNGIGVVTSINPFSDNASELAVEYDIPNVEELDRTICTLQECFDVV